LLFLHLFGFFSITLLTLMMHGQTHIKKLLNVAYKILSSILLEWLKEYSEEILGEYQCDFRRGRKTTDQIFTVRQILDKFYAYDVDLHIFFIDFKNLL